jgi:voltage-dependent calcium channel T type alpha-1G
MDFCIVCLSIISIVMRDVELGIIKVLRMLRVLRPLRMISRNPGLRIAVQSLINAIPDIGNVMVVSVLFLLLFAILGTNMYKGLFFYCLTDNVPEGLADKITDKFDCMDYGGEWVNKDQNFDGVLSSIITLFNVMTTEGWIGVMWDAVDASAIDKVP